MNISREKFGVLVCTLISVLLQSCSSDIPTENRMLVFMDKLPPTTENLVYELWYEDGDDFTSIQRFETSTGIVNLSIPMTAQLQEATTLIVTLEPTNLISDTVSDTVLLAGDFIDGIASLTVAHPLALGTGFSSASGSYRLDTPTSSKKTDFDQGIWWFDTIGDVPVQSLFLPELPTGWIYEAWVIGGEKPLSIGKFPDPGRFDSDLAGVAASDTLEAPLFPGQDYINPPELIPAYTAMITVEPKPDYSPLPFEFEILIDQVIEAIDVNQPMENRTERGLPSGSITRNTESF